jgi:hypothetical protein
MRNTFKTAASVALATVGLVGNSQAQSADALIDKLVDKGILTVKEANDLREEADKGFNSAYSIKSGMPDWVNSLKFNGDLRGRYESITVEAPGVSDRNRFRYRLRFGAVAVIKDDFEVGFRLTSSDPASGGTGGDPISGNTSFSSNGSKKLVYIDQAYGKWSPLHTGGWLGNVVIGKMDNPFVTSDITFDQDYTPEGAAAAISYSLNDMHTFKAIGGAFILNEVSADSNDPFYFGAQFRMDSKWSAKFQTSAGVAFYSIERPDQLTTAAIPNQNVGNTRLATGALVNDYRPVVVDASATYFLDSFPLYKGAFPIRAFGDYEHNSGAPSDRNTGYSAGVAFGKSGKRGTWDISYRYKYLESDAWFEELVDSDTGAYYPVAFPGGATGYRSGTNVKGHVVRGSYSPFDAFTLGVTYFLTELVEKPDSPVETGAGRLQVDANWKF